MTVGALTPMRAAACSILTNRLHSRGEGFMYVSRAESQPSDSLTTAAYRRFLSMLSP